MTAKHQNTTGKQIVLVRHGESQGQTSAARGLSRDDISLLDCPLSDKGLEQARAMWPGQFPSPDLVVTSPLKRALQTSMLAFPAHHRSPMICSPGIKECGGQDGWLIPENTQRPVAEIKHDADLLAFEHFRALDMSLVEDEISGESRKGSAGNSESRQLKQFVKWLSWRKERVIVVVCHYNVIMELLGGQLDRVKNCQPLLCSLVGHGEQMRLTLSKDAGSLCSILPGRDAPVEEHVATKRSKTNPKKA